MRTRCFSEVMAVSLLVDLIASTSLAFHIWMRKRGTSRFQPAWSTGAYCPSPKWWSGCCFWSESGSTLRPSPVGGNNLHPGGRRWWTYPAVAKWWMCCGLWPSWFREMPYSTLGTRRYVANMSWEDRGDRGDRVVQLDFASDADRLMLIRSDRQRSASRLDAAGSAARKATSALRKGWRSTSGVFESFCQMASCLPISAVLESQGRSGWCCKTLRVFHVDGHMCCLVA